MSPCDRAPLSPFFLKSLDSSDPICYSTVRSLGLVVTLVFSPNGKQKTQLLEPGRYIWLLKALYGLLMLLPQQSSAFKILRTRLKTVPSYSFGGDQFKRTSSGNPYQILHQMPSGSHIMEDGERNQDTGNAHNGINFYLRLQQFERMQQQHRMHSKSEMQSRNSTSSTLSQEVQRPEEHRRPASVSEIIRPPSRSSWRGSGQSQP